MKKVSKPTSKQRLRLYKKTLKDMLANPTWGTSYAAKSCLCIIMKEDIYQLTRERRWLDELPEHYFPELVLQRTTGPYRACWFKGREERLDALFIAIKAVEENIFPD